MKRFHPRGDRRLGKQDRRQLHVLYEDDAVVVLNKRPQLLAVPADDSDTPSALSILSAELKSKRQRAFVVHRIDRLTSGILLFAKTWPDREALVQQFIRHTPVREYLAAVRGHLHFKEGTLVHYFRQEGMFQKVTTECDPKSARAELRYSVEHRLRDGSLVRVSLVRESLRWLRTPSGLSVSSSRFRVPNPQGSMKLPPCNSQLRSHSRTGHDSASGSGVIGVKELSEILRLVALKRRW